MSRVVEHTSLTDLVEQSLDLVFSKRLDYLVE